MRCPNCGSEIQNEANYCGSCGKKFEKRGTIFPDKNTEKSLIIDPPQNLDQGKRAKKKRLKNKLLMFSIIAVIFLICIFCLAVYLSASELQVIEETEYSMSLSADRTDFRIGEEATVKLTIHNPDSNRVGIYDDAGNRLALLTENNIDENGNWSVELNIYSDESRSLKLTARSNNGQSMPLTMRIIPEITSEMLQECQTVLDDLAVYLLEQGYDENSYDKESLTLVEEWLCENKNVAATSRENNMVLFVTNNHVAGAFMLPLSENTFGSPNYEKYMEGGAIANCYRVWSNGYDISNSFIPFGNVTTNNTALILSPLYGTTSDTLGNCAKSTDKYEKLLNNFEDECLDHQSILAYKGLDALKLIFGGNSQQTTDREILILNTHGSTFNRNDGSSLLTFLLYGNNQELYHALMEIDSSGEKEETSIDGFYADFRADITGNDEPNSMVKDDIRLFISNTGIWATSNFIMNQYQDSWFDNTIIYFGVCYGASDENLVQFFLSHGAAAFAGYRGSINCDVERGKFRSFFSALTEMKKKEQRYQTVEEATESSYTFFGSIWARINDFISDQDLYVNSYRQSFTLYGYGTLTGIIEATETSNETIEIPEVSGARITIYRYLNKNFEEVASATANDDGSFSFPDLTWGAYAVTVEKDGFIPSLTQIIFENANQDGGIIYLEPEEDMLYTDTGEGEIIEIFASQIIRFMEGEPWTELTEAQNPTAALGAPDYHDDLNALTLGGSGMLIVSFDESFTDIDGNDITVYETGNDIEPVEVAVSNDCETWYIVGNTSGGTSSIDINGSVPKGMSFQYIRIIDLELAADGTWPGADIDAISVNVYHQ